MRHPGNKVEKSRDYFSNLEVELGIESKPGKQSKFADTVFEAKTYNIID